MSLKPSQRQTTEEEGCPAETQTLRLPVVHCDIENHGKIVTSLIKVCQRTDASCNNASAKRVAENLEKRWHLVFLKSLEWQCHIENLLKSEYNLSDTELEDEPAVKHPRLTVPTPSADELDGLLVKGVDKHDLIFTEDQSHYTRSNRQGTNQATYYFKHIDTDSEMDKHDLKLEKPEETHNQCEETTDDEEEWTFSVLDLKDRNGTEENGDVTKPITENIHYLVQKAEELVRESPAQRARGNSIEVPVNKLNRVKQWLNIQPKDPDSSCDASGEDDERDSQTSEENDESVITYRALGCNSQNTSFVDLEATPKVVKRGKLSTDIRPWSVSCISQLTGRMNDEPKNFSTSESALYSLSKNYQDTNGCNGQGNNSTSSTVEESSALVFEDKCSSSRRKRFKIRKRYDRKNNGSPYHSMTLIKSGSFSGHSHIRSKADRHSVSDPSAISICHFMCDSTSGGESEDNRKLKRLSSLKTPKRQKSVAQVDIVRDGSPGKNSLIAAEEQSSSMSEQAWDGFQEEAYLSEQYSETHDSDAARKLLEFGEDYGNFLGSQSDWSASTNPGFSPPFPRKMMLPATIKEISLHSDSDCDSDIRSLLRANRQEFNSMDKIYKRQLEIGLTDYLVNNDVTDVLDNCNCFIEVLTDVLNRDNSPGVKGEVQDLLSSWRSLKDRALTMKQYRELQRQILFVKDALHLVKAKISEEVTAVDCIDDIARDIDFYTVELDTLLDHKSKLFTLIGSVHKFILSDKEYSSSFLKRDISELHRTWYEVHSGVLGRLALLKDLKQSWQTLEKRLDKLRIDLKEDEQTLDQILDAAVKGDVLSNQTLSSLRDVDKLLSEASPDNSVEGYPKISEFLFEGSCSDSGMSDEGSEHEPGEREHRLWSIRKSVKQLEAVMSPNCVIRVLMGERLAAAEEELKSVRKKCQSLVVRTCPSMQGSSSVESTSTAPDGGDPSYPQGSTKTSWLRRVTRVSIPFQLALMAILCVACLLEPHCCDNMNTFSLSLTPHLHYVRGPPPA
ncbi:klarsicht protein isoform X2 [Onthophagus taurus]|uniref:klarsicht protein isoform X2 n=1 Tax=Onthophagus taurus TaxID=166361 RepID=UPI000C20D703|nr:uncharacterized protein LOC111425620 isoform X2 [Onthophagus taurus]